MNSNAPTRSHGLADVDAVLASSDGDVSRVVEKLGPRSLHVGSSRESFLDALTHAHPDAVVLYDLQMPELSGFGVLEALRSRGDDVPVVILTTGVLQPDFTKLMDLNADYVTKPLNPNELLSRVHLAVGRVRRQRNIPRSLDPVFPHLVEQLHDLESGRLDAKRTADFFGVSLAELQRATGQHGRAIYKTPNAKPLQPLLRTLEAIASGLIRLTGSPNRARIWLNSMNPALDGHAPIELIKNGNIEALSSFVQDLLEGRPA
jgi:DNA-binding response OmpR family regulator